MNLCQASCYIWGFCKNTSNFLAPLWKKFNQKLCEESSLKTDYDITLVLVIINSHSQHWFSDNLFPIAQPLMQIHEIDVSPGFESQVSSFCHLSILLSIPHKSVLGKLGPNHIYPSNCLITNVVRGQIVSCIDNWTGVFRLEKGKSMISNMWLPSDINCDDNQIIIPAFRNKMNAEWNPGGSFSHPLHNHRCS